MQSSTSEPTQHAHYLYDAGGVRVKKLVRVQGGTYTSTVYIDGIFEYKTDGTHEQNTLHVMDDKSRIATIRLGDIFGDTTPKTKYNLEDHLGSSTLQLKANGANISSEEYYPFGETSFGSYAKKRYKYCGKERDEESGLYYYGARYYNAWTGRFVSVDALALQFNFLTPYAYANNNPIMLIDPTGNKAEKADNIGGGGGGKNRGSTADEHSKNVRTQDGIESSTDPDLTYTFEEPACIEPDANCTTDEAAVVEYEVYDLEFIEEGQIGILRSATKEHWDQNKFTAFLKDFSFAIIEIVGLNAVDDAVAAWMDPNASTSAKIVSTLDAAQGFFGGKKGGKVKGSKVQGPNVKPLKANTPKSINQLNEMVHRNQAPEGIQRFDKGKGTVNLPQDEVTFTDNSSLYRDGTWRHHYGHQITNKQSEFLQNHGWKIPKQ